MSISIFRTRSWKFLCGAFLLLTGFYFFDAFKTITPNDLLTHEERQWLAEHPVIRLAPDPDFPPTDFFSATGRHSGISADYIKLLEKRLGIRFQIVKLQTWENVLQQVNNRNVDVLAAVTSTPERREYLRFTKPYLQIPATLVTKNTYEGPQILHHMSGRKVAIKAGYAARYYVTTNYPLIQVEVVPDIHTGLQRVTDGSCDAFLENLFSASYYLDKESLHHLRIARKTEFIYNLSFATRSDWPMLQRILDKGLDTISEQERELIHRKWVPKNADIVLVSEWLLPILFTVIGSVALIAAGVFFWNRSLMRQVAKRTVLLEKELAERQRMETALRESEEKFRVLAETSPAAIFLYQGERLIYVNPAAIRLTGYSEQECLSMKFWEWVDPDVQEIVRSYGIARQSGQQAPERYETVIRTSSGEKIYVLVSAGRVVYRGAPAGIASAFDITDRKIIEQELQQTNSELEQRVVERTAELTSSLEALQFAQFAVERASDQAFWINRKGCIVYVNQAACRCLGYSSQELCALAIDAIDVHCNGDTLEHHWKTLRDQGCLVYESVHRSKSGCTYPVEVRANYVVFDNQEYNCCFISDISERKRVENALLKAHDDLESRVRERTQQLRSLTAELSRAEELERRRIASELHDQIAQTLALVKIKLNGVLLAENIPPDREELRESVDHLSSAIDDVRSLTFQLSPPLLHELGVAAALEWLGDQLQDKYKQRITFVDQAGHISLDETLRNALYRMARELLINAIKHAKAHTIKIVLALTQGVFTISITDDGVGFDYPATLQSSSNTFSFGLLSVHHRMNHLGGDFLVTSYPGQGTVAVLSLPLPGN